MLRFLGASGVGCLVGARDAFSQGTNSRRPLYLDVVALGVATGKLAGSSGPSVSALRLLSNNVLDRVAAAMSDVTSLHTSIYARYPELGYLLNPTRSDSIYISTPRLGSSTESIRWYANVLNELRKVPVSARPAAIADKRSQLSEVLASVQATAPDFRPNRALVGFAAGLVASEVHLLVLTGAPRSDVDRALAKYESWFSATGQQVTETVNAIRVDRSVAHRQLGNVRQPVRCWNDRSAPEEKSRKCTGVRDNRECEDVTQTTYKARVTFQEFRYQATDDLPPEIQPQFAWLTSMGGLRQTDLPRKVASTLNRSEAFGTWDNGRDALVNPLLPREQIVPTIQRWLEAGNKEACSMGVSDKSEEADYLQNGLQFTGFSLVAHAGLSGACRSAARSCQLMRQELAQQL